MKSANISSRDGKGGALSSVTGIAILLGTALPALVSVGLTPILPQIEAHFGAEADVSVIVRLLMSVVGPAVVLGAPIAGLLASRFGERKILTWACALFGLAGCVAFVLDNLYAILASRFVLGLAVGATGTVTTVILTKLYAGQARNRWLGYYGTTGSLMVLAFIPLCGFLGAINWRLVFLIHALAFPLIWLFILVLPKDRPRELPSPIGLKAASSARPPVPLALIVMALACGSISGSVNLFLPFHLAGMGVTDASKIGMLLLPAALTCALSAFAFGAVRSRLSATSTFALVFSLVGAGLMIVALATSLNAIVVGLIVQGLGVGSIVPNLYAVAAATGVEADRSRNMGFAKGAYFAGPLLSQSVLEPVARYGSAAAAILTIGAFAFLLGVWSVARVSTLKWRTGRVGDAKQPVERL